MTKHPTASVPTKAEFAAASEKMRRRIQQGTVLKKAILAACAPAPVFHDTYVWLSDNHCRIDLFVRLETDVSSAAAATLKAEVMALIISALEPRREVSVVIDSHERVLREFNGDYLKFFR